MLSDSTNDYLYGPDGAVVEQANLASGAPQYFVSDDQASTRALLSSAGSIDATFSFDPYGNLVSSSGTATTPLLYDGQYQDAATGLYYLRARWYDPGTGQFMSVDPDLAQTDHPYVYAGDNPVNADDPSGLDTKFGLTLGLCGNAYAAIGEIVGLGGQGEFCGLSSSSGNPGVSLTGGVAAANVGATIVGTFDYVASDAGSVNQMAGPFYAVQSNLNVAGGALEGTVFWGASQPPDNTSMFGPLTGIFGYEDGLGFGLPPVGGDVGIWLQDTKVHEFGGWACWLSGLCLLGRQIAKAVALFAPSRSKAEAILRAAWQVVEKYTEPSLKSCPTETPAIET